jgi:hypothetical protein
MKLEAETDVDGRGGGRGGAAAAADEGEILLDKYFVAGFMAKIV